MLFAHSVRRNIKAVLLEWYLAEDGKHGAGSNKMGVCRSDNLQQQGCKTF